MRDYKTVVIISDVRPTNRPEIVEITLAENGKSYPVRRDDVEFFKGKCVMPLWLFNRFNMPSLKKGGDVATVEFCGEVRRETEKALLIHDGVNEVWIAKRLIKGRRNIGLAGDAGSGVALTIPEWVAKDKGII